MTSERRRLFIGTSWTLASTGVALVVGVVLRGLVVANVGVDGYGNWASALAIASIVSLAGDLGVAGALTKWVAESRGREPNTRGLATAALLFALSSGAVIGFVLASISGSVERYLGFPNFSVLLKILALQTAPNLGISALFAVLQGRRRFRALALATVVHLVGNLSASWAALVLGWGLAGLMSASLAVTGVMFLVLVSLLHEEFELPRLSAIARDLRLLMPFGMKIAVTNGLNTFLYNIDVVVLSFLLVDAQVVGQYALAVFLVRALWIVPGSIGLTTYPVVSEYLAAREGRRLARYVEAALTTAVAVTGILVAGFLLFGKPLIRLLFGLNAMPAYGLAVILIPGTAVLGSLRSVAASITGAGRPGIGLKISGIGASILTMFLLVLTPLLGQSGTAIAVSITFLIVGAMLAWAVNEYVISPTGEHIRPRRILATSATAVIASVVAGIGALAPAADLGALGVAAAMWLGILVILFLASGAMETWGGLLRDSGGSNSAIDTNPTITGGSSPIRRARRPSHIRAKSALFLLPAWFSPLSSLRVGFHRLRGARISRTAEVGYFVIIDNLYPEKVVIEDHATVSARTTILSHDESQAYTGRGSERVGETRICQGAFVGVHCVILPGVTVGARAIVGAGSVVTRDVPEDTTVVGVPARIVSPRESTKPGE